MADFVPKFESLQQLSSSDVLIPVSFLKLSKGHISENFGFFLGLARGAGAVDFAVSSALGEIRRALLKVVILPNNAASPAAPSGTNGLCWMQPGPKNSATACSDFFSLIISS